MSFYGAGGGLALPLVSLEDNNKILYVVDGKWTLVHLDQPIEQYFNNAFIEAGTTENLAEQEEQQ